MTNDQAPPIEYELRDLAAFDDPSSELADEPRGLARVGRVLTHPLSSIAVTLVLTVVLAALFLGDRSRSAEDAARVDALEVVTPHVTKILSYTPDTVASDLATEKKWLTGEFLADYTVLVTETVAPAAVEGNVTATAKVVASGIEAASADRVELLLFINVATTRSDATTESQGSRVRVVAEKVDGAWLISSLSPV